MDRSPNRQFPLAPRRPVGLRPRRPQSVRMQEVQPRRIVLVAGERFHEPAPLPVLVFDDIPDVEIELPVEICEVGHGVHHLTDAPRTAQALRRPRLDESIANPFEPTPEVASLPARGEGYLGQEPRHGLDDCGERHGWTL